MKKQHQAEKIQDIFNKRILEGASLNHNQLPTHVDDLDSLFGGYKRGELYFIAGRPAMGCTKFLVEYATAASRNHRVLFYSLNHSKVQLTSRIVNQLLNRNLHEPVDENMYLKDALKVEKHLRKRNIQLHDFRYKNHQTFLLELEMHLQNHPTDVLLIDSIQAFHLPKKDQESFAFALKLLAEKRQIAILIESKIHPKCEQKPNLNPEKRPTLNQIHYKKALTDIANSIILLYRPEYYGYTSNSAGEPISNHLQLIIPKKRWRIPRTSCGFGASVFWVVECEVGVI
jgi:replicative DNA helicase